MIITQLSVSQIESFDHDQNGGCNRRYWFERVHGLKPEQDSYQSDGSKGHALLAAWLARGEMPGKRVKLGKAVTSAILKGDLPRPGGDLIVESRFSGQPQWEPMLDEYTGSPMLDADGNPRQQWVELDKSKTLWLAGIPLDGAIDLAYRRGPVPRILDHKFSTDIENYAKRSDQLIRTVQMPVYALSQMPYWPDAEAWDLAHHYVSKTGTRSFIREARHTTAELLERKAEIEALIETMKPIARATDQNDVPFNRRSCHSWLGCPHQAHCSAFRSNAMQLTPDEEMLLNGDSMDVEHRLDDLPPLEDMSTVAPVVDAKAAARAKLKAELAALDADPAPPPTPAAPKRRIVDVDVELPPAAPPPAAPKRRIAIVDVELPCLPTCPLCAIELTPDNSSRLTSGVIKHIGCPKESSILAPDAATSRAELASEPAKVAPKARAAKALATPLEGTIGGGALATSAPMRAHDAVTPPPRASLDVTNPTCTVTIQFANAAEAAKFLARFG